MQLRKGELQRKRKIRSMQNEMMKSAAQNVLYSLRCGLDDYLKSRHGNALGALTKHISITITRTAKNIGWMWNRFAGSAIDCTTNTSLRW